MNLSSVVTNAVAATAVVVGVSYAAGRLFQRFRQPEVVGQLLAGIALGPSLLGRFGSGVMHAIFPVNIVPYLSVMSQIALILFLFAMGYEMDIRVLKRESRTVPVVSFLAFTVPMLLGISSVYALAGWYRATGESRPENVAFVIFAGLAVSITAVPVLLSIVAEYDIAGTIPGITATASAVVIDAVSWLALTGVLVLASATSAGHRPWDITALLLVGYVAVMLLVVRPLLRAWMRARSPLSGNVPVAVVLALGSAWVTSALGLQVIFGAFFAGAIMPRQFDGNPDADVLRPVLDTGRLLLPLFFIVSGLSIDLDTLHAKDFALFAVVCVIAFAGKFGAGWLGARISGMSNREARTVGILLNARGLTELIALNVGLDAGIINKRLYAVFVLMAVLMTLATGPLLRLPGPHVRAERKQAFISDSPC